MPTEMEVKGTTADVGSRRNSKSDSIKDNATLSSTG